MIVEIHTNDDGYAKFLQKKIGFQVSKIVENEYETTRTVTESKDIYVNDEKVTVEYDVEKPTTDSYKSYDLFISVKDDTYKDGFLIDCQTAFYCRFRFYYIIVIFIGLFIQVVGLIAFIQFLANYEKEKSFIHANKALKRCLGAKK